MIDYIGSETYRRFLKDENIHLDPMDKAALIMRTDVSMDDRIESLKELLSEYSNEVLHKELNHLIRNWEYTQADFALESENIVFRILSSTSKKGEYFSNLGDAVRIGISLGESFIVEKSCMRYKIKDGSLLPETEITSDAFYGSTGELLYIYPMLTADNSTVCTLSNRYVGLRHPFYRGVLLKHIGYEQYGVSRDFRNSQEQVKYIEKCKLSGEINDLSDTVALYLVWDDGEFSVECLPLTQLEIVSEEQVPDRYKNILREAALLLKGEGSIADFQHYEKELRKSSNKEDEIENPMI